MREIEFRGLRKDGKGWVYGDLFAGDRIVTTTISDEGLHTYTYHEVVPNTVGQYTGVDDFNGEKLYEDDRVAWVDSDGVDREDVIVWLNGGLVLCNGSYTVGSYIGKKLKKVGNIHEGGEK